MPTLPIAKPDAIGFDAGRLQRAYDLLQRWVDTDRVPAAGICIGRKGQMLEPRFFGRMGPDPKSPALRKDALFLLASPTKPVTVLAVLILLERGELVIARTVAGLRMRTSPSLPPPPSPKPMACSASPRRGSPGRSSSRDGG